MTSREIVIVILVAAGVVLVGVVVLGLLWGLGGMWGFSAHMGGPGMMGGLTILWWLLVCLVPLGLGALLVGGIIWLLTSRSNLQTGAPPAQDTCPNCGEVVQKNWNNCPNCGQSLRSVQ